ncbi:MAG: anthranilate synthase component I family protein [Cryobacterium sp.]|nr:anthranilate synthase component I family protein [Cryobacterium sp.]
MRARPQVIPASDWIDPEVVFRHLSEQSDAVFWLDSGTDASEGWSFMGTSEEILEVAAGEQSSTGSDSLERLLLQLRSRSDSIEFEGPLPTGAPFGLGWVGWIGFELGMEAAGVTAKFQSLHQKAAFLFASRVLAFDHKLRQLWTVSLGSSESDREWHDQMGALARGAHSDPARPKASREAAALSKHSRWEDSDESYLAKIRQCQEQIRQGRAYQLCLTNQIRVEGEHDPVAVYLRLRSANPSHHGGFIRIGGTSLLSTSPEIFLSVEPDGEVSSRPIKGTRPRGGESEADDALRVELLESVKEQAENVMIVDLVRNDLGRVCELGSVSVPDLFKVESYPRVHQLVSIIRGTLAKGKNADDAIAAIFPAGSMTGAPKQSALELLQEIEGRARGIYSGIFGYLGLNQRAEFAMVIRSIVIDSSAATIGAGGGITSLSDPEFELREVKIKAEVMLEALGAVVR